MLGATGCYENKGKQEVVPMLRELMSIEEASDSNRKIAKNMTVKTTKNVSHCGTQRPEASSLPR